MSSRLLAAIVLAGACATAVVATPGAGLGGGRWRLLDVGGTAAVPSDTAARPWLSFITDSSIVEGHLGCNAAGGPYATDGVSTLKFEPMMRTMMACADQAMNVQESAMARAIDSTDHYRVAGDTLELRRAERVLARFVRRTR